MKFLKAGTRVTLVRPQIREALDIALERRYRDVKERAKNPNKVKDYQSSPLHPIIIDFMGAAGEWAASHAITTLSGHTVDNDLTTHPRAGGDDITTPAGLPIDVKTRQGKPGERDLICPTTEGKVRELTQGRDQRAMLVMYADSLIVPEVILNTKLLARHRPPYPTPPEQELRLLESDRWRDKLLRGEGEASEMQFTVGGWLWSEYVMHPHWREMGRHLPAPTWLVPEHVLYKELPLETLPEMAPWETLVPPVRLAPPVDLSDLP